MAGKGSTVFSYSTRQFTSTGKRKLERWSQPLPMPCDVYGGAILESIPLPEENGHTAINSQVWPIRSKLEGGWSCGV